jgi:hypothetical protein
MLRRDRMVTQQTSSGWSMEWIAQGRAIPWSRTRYRTTVYMASPLYALGPVTTSRMSCAVFLIDQSIIPSVMQQIINLLLLSLNTTCFGPIWPSSGVWYCRNCHTASMFNMSCNRMLKYRIVNWYFWHCPLFHFRKLILFLSSRPGIK